MAVIRWILAALLVSQAHGAVLPDERVDVLHHNYNGGGMTINGPAVLVRKNFEDTVSIAGHYLVDSVSAASIDVESFASPYIEERIETSLAGDIIIDKTIYSIAYATSEENDYVANSYSFGLSQDFFGDLTTLALAFSLGDDEVGNAIDKSFSEDLDRRTYQLSLAQVLSPKSMLSLRLESISDEGYLNNPYRSVRYLDASSSKGWSAQGEVYPRTRHSNAVGLTLSRYFEHEGVVSADVRFFNDSWSITGQSLTVEYKHRVAAWVLSCKFRAYQQTAAEFYSDLFPFASSQTFMARDKELSEYSTMLAGFGLHYNLKPLMPRLRKSEMAIYFDRHMIDYENFRDIRHVSAVAGEEPLYRFGANVVRFNVSVWF